MTLLAFDEVEHELHVDVGLVVEHDLAAAEQRAERRPLPARVHQRTERERRRTAPAPGRPAAGTAAAAARGSSSTDAAICSGRGDRRAARVPAAERAEEDVLLAPHDALRPAGRAAGVEHVVVVGGAGAEVARGRARGSELARTRAGPSTSSANRTSRTARDATRRRVASTSASWTSATRSASREQVAQLVGDVAVVDVDRAPRAACSTRASPRGARRSCAGRGRRGRRRRTPAPRARARDGSRARRARRRCADRAPHDRRFASGHRVGDALEEVGEVELHAAPARTRRYSPILA